jgi:putative phosphoribosyl transferase
VSAAAPRVERELEVRVGELSLPGELVVPVHASGVVLFAHGSGSSRNSPRNVFVARALNSAGIGTFLFDLLTPLEDVDRSMVFDIPLLAERLSAATERVRADPEAARLPIGYFGASTGAGAALWAAGVQGSDVRAVVSRGGRPDLAAERLPAVRAPTLLLVGSRDPAVLQLNLEAREKMRCPARVEVVPGGSHLFEEPGTLERVAELASDWFARHLGRWAMDAKVGDRIALESEHVGAPEREGEVLEVAHGEVGVRYRVRWEDGRETIFTPAGGSVRVLSSK